MLLNKIDCFVGVWCNDSTAGFELASGGLIPPTPTKQKCILQSVLLFGQTISRSNMKRAKTIVSPSAPTI